MFLSFLRSVAYKFVLRGFLLRKYTAIRFRKLIKQTHEHYKVIEEQLKSRNNQPIRFAAYVVYDSSFGAYGLMDLMIADPDHYSPKIVICPDVSRGEHQLNEQYNKTKDFFEKKYGSEYIVDGYDKGTKTFFDVSSQFDVIYCVNPYDAMVHSYHSVRYLSTRQVLPVYMSYGFLPDNYGCKVIMPILEISLFWKVFAETEYTYQDYQKYELYKGRNVVLTGYAKMDSLAKCVGVKSPKKRIIIAPHHTITNKALPLSNFLELADFILELPKRYPDIEFIFRPHPLLFVNMVNEGFWTNEQVDKYISDVKSLGMVYSYGGDYFDIFVNSDAMIHDCSSFVAEYLFTGKPCCFVAKKNYKKVFASLGKACLANYYIASNKQDILHFIDEVIISGNDSLKEKRSKFAVNNLAINYPNVSKILLDEISVY